MLRRATLALAVTQLVSWGVLFYGFAVAAPEVVADTGWSQTAVAGAFSVGLLVAGLAAPSVARHLATVDARVVMTIGSVLGVVGMLGFAGARELPVLYGAWVVIGVAMAATLYEPAMAVLVAIDPTRRQRTLSIVTVAGGFASIVFAPVGGYLVGWLGWRPALVVLAVAGGTITASIHAFVLPPSTTAAIVPRPATPAQMRVRSVRALRWASRWEQGAIVATTTHLVGLLVERGTTLALAGAALGVMGFGKVAGRLLLSGSIVRRISLTALAAGACVAQLAGLLVPLVTTGSPSLFVSLAVVGAASGATTVLRPLLVIELVGPGLFAAVSASLHRSSTVARAAAPLALGAGAAALGWEIAWVLAVLPFAAAAGGYRSVGRRLTSETPGGCIVRPDVSAGV